MVIITEPMAGYKNLNVNVSMRLAVQSTQPWSHNPTTPSLLKFTEAERVYLRCTTHSCVNSLLEFSSFNDFQRLYLARIFLIILHITTDLRLKSSL